MIGTESSDFMEMARGIGEAILFQKSHSQFVMGFGKIGRDEKSFLKVGDGRVVLLLFDAAKSQFKMQPFVRGILADGFKVAFGRGRMVTAREHFIAEESLEMGIGSAFDALGFEQGGAGGSGRNGIVRGWRGGRGDWECGQCGGFFPLDRANGKATNPNHEDGNF
jgi:hypothetical protein